MSQVAQMLGVSEEQAEASVKAALPALLGGMAANASDPAGEASLAQALGGHADDGWGDDSSGWDLGAIDTDDGGKIVDHIFGSNRDEVVNRLSDNQQFGGLPSGMLMKLLPLLAPLLMKWLGGMFKNGGGLFGGAKTADATAGSGGSSRGGDISDAFDEMTRDDASSSASSASRARQTSSSDDDYRDSASDEQAGGGGLGDLLGGLLGGKGGGGGLGDLLGGLLGGGSR